jgi:hypothetical protein
VLKVGFFHAARTETGHGALAARLIQSVRRAMPRAAIVHLTDEATMPMAGVDEVRRRAGGPIALACLEAYAHAGPGPWLFVDTDVIVQRDVSSVFEEPFDIAVADRVGTLRPKEQGTKFMARMPHNKGAVFSRSSAFWFDAAALLRTMSEVRQDWMGDQVAMNLTIAAGRYRVRVLPSRYNYPPHRRDEDVSDKAILHFKGARKAWMLERAA